MPAAYIGHSGPSGAFSESPLTQAWRDYGESIPRPRALLIVSGHWYVNDVLVSATKYPETLHDYYGGTREMLSFRYPAPGDPELAERVAELAEPVPVGRDLGTWGLDHGSWSFLKFMFPAADVPVVQLSVSADLSFEEHVELGARLAPLRDEGVMIIGSGNVPHNRLVNPDSGAPPVYREMALAFLDDATEILTTQPGVAAKLREHPAYLVAAPTDDHFLPFLYFAGVASVTDDKVTKIIDGPAYGRYGQTSFALG